MSRYDPLQDHLERQTTDLVTMSLGEIDALVKLPAAAKRHDFWWSNDDPRTTIHAQSRAWQLAGYDAVPNLRGKRVTFRRKPEAD
ncbi:MAG: hypothetical protein JWQ36_628 [Enterovirga sp.]|nr:hypothetical protein [Enterovirga sp.]